LTALDLCTTETCGTACLDPFVKIVRICAGFNHGHAAKRLEGGGEGRGFTADTEADSVALHALGSCCGCSDHAKLIDGLQGLSTGCLAAGTLRVQCKSLVAVWG
jgi:hypothetical protein